MKSILNCVATVKNEFKRIDILCNNAGIDIFNDFFTFTTEMWDATMDTNIGGMFIMSREVGKIMKEQC
ncbi:SDR family NAD(P)-dependent oxidoreductase [uncultured Methanobrevibacter sp.]|uniref:SDR family NAD(P)-dependent oxidoreductase n=1 Tax=uncultured Methanobrevibacter sp. TaxID=253161 RepID=UPI00261BAFED